MHAILVFKTSVSTKKAEALLSKPLNNVEIVQSWNFDLEDCDHVLRVEAEAAMPEVVIQLLHSHGYECEELPD